jgi:hypothetical protein
MTTPAYLPPAGAIVRVLEIAPWDTMADHAVGDLVEAGECWLADANCNGRDDGEWLLLASDPLGGVFAEDGVTLHSKHTLCRVELVEAAEAAKGNAA